MSQVHKDAWDKFEQYFKDARARLEDKWAPVVLICIQADDAGDGTLNFFVERDQAGIWPANFPIPERGPLLERVGKTYRAGQVLR